MWKQFWDMIHEDVHAAIKAAMGGEFKPEAVVVHHYVLDDLSYKMLTIGISDVWAHEIPVNMNNPDGAKHSSDSLNTSDPFKYLVGILAGKYLLPKARATHVN